MQTLRLILAVIAFFIFLAVLLFNFDYSHVGFRHNLSGYLTGTTAVLLIISMLGSYLHERRHRKD
ncbi:hypothetical protein JXO52_09220 [bacterium]|nr:hypothetical protein [bacterium]